MSAVVVAHVDYEMGRIVMFDYEVAYLFGLHLIELKGRKPYVGRRASSIFSSKLRPLYRLTALNLPIEGVNFTFSPLYIWLFIFSVSPSSNVTV